MERRLTVSGRMEAATSMKRSEASRTAARWSAGRAPARVVIHRHGHICLVGHRGLSRLRRGLCGRRALGLLRNRPGTQGTRTLLTSSMRIRVSFFSLLVQVPARLYSVTHSGAKHNGFGSAGGVSRTSPTLITSGQRKCSNIPEFDSFSGSMSYSNINPTPLFPLQGAVYLTER